MAINIEPITNIEQMVHYVKTLPIQKQKSVFDYIGSVVADYKNGHTELTMVDLINQYPMPTSFKADDVVAMQRQWRDEWE